MRWARFESNGKAQTGIVEGSVIEVRGLGLDALGTSPRLAIDAEGARAGVLDPIGTALPAGSELYFKLMRNIAASLERCLLGGG